MRIKDFDGFVAEELQESRLKRGIAGLALASSLACMPSCKVKDSSEDTIRIEQPTYSAHKNAYFPGDEIGIELMPQHQSHIKDYVVTIKNSKGVAMVAFDGELDDAGAYINWVIPKSYPDYTLDVELTGTNVLGKSFEPIRRTINISR